MVDGLEIGAEGVEHLIVTALGVTVDVVAKELDAGSCATAWTCTCGGNPGDLVTGNVCQVERCITCDGRHGGGG